MLVDYEIENLIKNTKMVKNHNPENIQPNSLDLQLGYEFKQICVRSDYVINPEKPPLESDYTTIKCNDDEYILLYPNQFILGTTIEEINLPNNISAIFEGKSSNGRLGLMTHITARFIDSGFNGNITVELSNVNGYPIKIKPKMLIGQMCFYRNEKCNKSYGFYKNRYQGQKGTTVAL